MGTSTVALRHRIQNVHLSLNYQKLQQPTIPTNRNLNRENFRHPEILTVKNFNEQN